MKKLAKVKEHLHEDIKTFKKEAKEDKALLKSLGEKKMKKQGYNDRMDESLGMRNGKKKQSLKDRRDESKGMEKAMGKRPYSAVKSMDKMAKKPKIARKK